MKDVRLSRITFLAKVGLLGHVIRETNFSDVRVRPLITNSLQQFVELVWLFPVVANFVGRNHRARIYHAALHD
jgi:hypothetical protein